jgi:serine phosphatase RsbU (regulator of sigma subunit)
MHSDPTWRFPFKYKLALSTALIIVILLGGAFIIFQRIVEENAVAEIKQDLANTKTLVASLIENRRFRLNELSTAIGGDRLVRVILTDKTLERVTTDDIAENEILPNYPQLSLLCVADAEGNVLASNTEASALIDLLITHSAYRSALKGLPGGGFILKGRRLVQIALRPLLIGPDEEREMIGVVVVGTPWTESDLKRIKELTRADIALLNAGEIFLTSGSPLAVSFQGKSGKRELLGDIEQLPQEKPTIRRINGERFLLWRVEPQSHISPPYIIARSLDRQLDFVRNLRRTIFHLAAAGIGIGLLVSLLLALGISRPVNTLEVATSRVESGDYDHPVVIRSRDEFSRLGKAFNQMLEGLKEKQRMEHALLLAEEVQQNLLPVEPPQFDQLDLAAGSVYCQAIGGDYYDFLGTRDSSDARCRVVVGDVSDHGTAAALLMATVRATLRSRTLLPGDMSRIITDVNRYLAMDVKESGNFVAMFFLEIDLDQKKLRWVRAGHEPALMFDPATGTFERLSGEGIALGVDADFQYEQYSRPGMSGGQILVMATDGIWEARNPSGEMFGFERFQEAIRRHAPHRSEEIVTGILADLASFREEAELADDITLVVVKMKAV